ncbi:putative transcription factor interactor and regulator CCHC(Zn) family [Helianthus anomalus]
MPESSSIEGEIPQFSLPKPPIPPDPSSNSPVIQSVVKNGCLSPPIDDLCLQPPPSFEDFGSVDPPNPSNVESVLQISNGSRSNTDERPPIDSNNNNRLSPHLIPKPKACSPKNHSKSSRGRGAKPSSGDPELDAARAAAIAHDVAIQQEFDKARGITRSTRSRSKQSGVQIAGFGVVRKQKKSVKYSPMLADLRVKDFVDNSPQAANHLPKQNEDHKHSAQAMHSDKAQGGPVSDGNQLSRVADVVNSVEGITSGLSIPVSVNLVHQEDVELVSVHSDETDEEDIVSVQDQDNIQPPVQQDMPTQDLHMGEFESPTVQQPPVTTLVAEAENHRRGNVWLNQDAMGLSFAERIKHNNAAGKVRLEYIPPVITPEGKCRVILSNDDLLHSAKAYPLYLYGYFVGTSMDFNVVNRTLRRLWHAYDIAEITKSSAGYFYFKFYSENGLNEVLENGPWLVNNVPIFLNKWAPGLCLEKVEPKTIHIWVTVHSVPLELWTDLGMSKIFSGIGRPLLLDKVTHSRVTEQTGKLGYARMLVEAKASANLPNEVEVEFPPNQNREAHVGVLKVTYQWKPSVCSFCEVFGHSFSACKTRPRSETDPQQVAANNTAPLIEEGMTNAQNNNEKEFTQISRKKNVAAGKKKVDMGKGVYNSQNTTDGSLKQQGETSGTKKGGSSFNFGRAVQGLSSQKWAVKQSQKPAVKQPQHAVKQPSNDAVKQSKNAPPVPKKAAANQVSSGGFKAAVKQPVCSTSNRFAALVDENITSDVFSVMDFEASLQTNSLVGSPIDLDQPENSCEERCITNQQTLIDPDYGISDQQKKRILNALRSDAKAVKAEDQDEWVDGEWEFFYDKCAELDLDPDFCVEDVYEDDSGSAQFLTQLAKTGKFSDPVVAKPHKK